jgi:hypothetical protein
MLELAEISARLEIYEVLMRYVRGVDRRDSDLVQSAYFPDAVDVRSYSTAESSPAEFGERVVVGFGDTPEFSQHHMTNVDYDIDVANGVADVESYVLVFHPVGPQTAMTLRPADGGTYVRFAGARYIDRFECRDGEWRIARRAAIVDWAKADLNGEDAPVLSQWQGDLAPGVRQADPAYRLSRAATQPTG